MKYKFNKNQFVTILLGVVLLLILILYYYPKIFFVSQKVYEKYIIKKSIYTQLKNKERINILVFSKDFDSETNSLQYIYIGSYEPVTAQLGVVYIPPTTKFSGLSKTDFKDINDVYQQKGINFLIKKLEEYLNISIPFYLSFKHGAFEKLLNLVGGVNINIVFPIRYVDKDNNKFYLLTTGQQLLFAPKILEYITYPGGDSENKEIDNIYRQQNFFKAFIEKLNEEKDLFKSPKAIELINSYLDESNLKKSDEMELIKILYELKHYNFQMAKIPGEIKKYDEDEFFTPNVLAIKNILPQPYEEIVEKDEVDDRITVRILNSTGIAGLSGKLRNKFLEYYDIDVVEVGNFPKKNPYTIIKDNSNNFRSAQRIREILQAGKIIKNKKTNDLVDIEIIIGQDYKEYIK